MISEISKFIDEQKNDPRVHNGDVIEIEAKWGSLMGFLDSRLDTLETYTECLLNTPKNFSSSITEEHFQQLNYQLNLEFEKSKSFNFKPNIYVQSFFEVDVQFRGNVRGIKNSRNEFVSFLYKERLNDIHLYLPNDPYDIRISSNIEREIHDFVVKDEITESIGIREKHRISYFFQVFRIDLTQVIAKNSAGIEENSTFEVEMEIDYKMIQQLLKPIKNWSHDRLSFKGKIETITDVAQSFYDNIKAINIMLKNSPNVPLILNGKKQPDIENERRSNSETSINPILPSGSIETMDNNKEEEEEEDDDGYSGW
eukprot:TRINITY_DN1567_c0_g1_i2.p1 TRINITY_DN1567_c0_g1~~TRINITY_DN1567_c0_g1_i2.p1  ORF type:complete len:312 (-),score=80.10 TRINITY_DN1567_c0_g1_i2:1200-2135(-)